METETEKAADTTEMIQSEGDIIEKGKPGKIFILASSDMIKDNLLDKEGRGVNDIFVMNILDYLNEQEGVARLRSKQQRFTPLNKTDAFTKTAVKALNIAGLPVVVVFFGLAVWARRTRRKKTIQDVFRNNRCSGPCNTGFEKRRSSHENTNHEKRIHSSARMLPPRGSSEITKEAL